MTQPAPAPPRTPPPHRGGTGRASLSRPPRASALADLARACLVALGLLLVACAAKVAIDSRAAYLAGAALEARARQSRSTQEATAAVERYASAVESYVPFVTQGHAALAQIEALGSLLAARGERAAAQRLWLRGIDAARSVDLLYEPYALERARLEALVAAATP